MAKNELISAINFYLGLIINYTKEKNRRQNKCAKVMAKVKFQKIIV